MFDYIKKHWGKLLIALIGLVPFTAAATYALVSFVVNFPWAAVTIVVWICCLITANNYWEGKFKK